MIKSEIVIQKAYFSELTQVLEKAEISGYTALEIYKSSGTTGARYSDGLSEDTSLLVITLSTVETSKKLAEAVKPLLKKTNALLLMTRLEAVLNL